MLEPFAFKAVSYGLILFLAFVALVLSLVSLKKEYIGAKPLLGVFPPYPDHCWVLRLDLSAYRIGRSSAARLGSA